MCVKQIESHCPKIAIQKFKNCQNHIIVLSSISPLLLFSDSISFSFEKVFKPKLYFQCILDLFSVGTKTVSCSCSIFQNQQLIPFSCYTSSFLKMADGSCHLKGQTKNVYCGILHCSVLEVIQKMVSEIGSKMIYWVLIFTLKREKLSFIDNNILLVYTYQYTYIIYKLMYILTCT